MQDLISVIIPIYNGEKYLPACFDSLSRQTYPTIEFLLIDDGSKDGSAAVCRAYCEKDSRFKYYYKENGGVSSARNLGLSIAAGEYIGFCDCDDWIENDYFETLYRLITENNTDVSVISYYSEPGHIQFPPAGIGKDSCVLNREEAFIEMFRGVLYQGHLVTKLFKRSVLEGLTSDTKIRIYEDLDFCMRAFDRIQSLCYQNLPKYYYIQHENSALHKKTATINMEPLAVDENAYAFLSKYDARVKNQAAAHLLWTVCNMTLGAQRNGQYDKALYQTMKQYVKKYRTKEILAQCFRKVKIRTWFYLRPMWVNRMWFGVETLWDALKKIRNRTNVNQ